MSKAEYGGRLQKERSRRRPWWKKLPTPEEQIADNEIASRLYITHAPKDNLERLIQNRGGSIKATKLG